MVMANPPTSGQDETPSAQHVGREFVRQYYTLMNEQPENLHRFYSQNSSFVHGGIEKPGEEQPPVTGQTAIYEKIKVLNFNDCHTKIRQVDSQPTVGDGVVIQVTGELSNNGQAMRRFMQTFVLAPQSAKKYYVHNAVFRYQDEVFPEEEEELDMTPQELPMENCDSLEAARIDQEVPLHYEEPAQPMSNGDLQQEEVEAEQLPVEPTVPEPHLETEMDSLDMEEPLEKVEPVEQAPVIQEPEPEPEPVEPPKPCTWAAMASKNTQNTAGSSVSAPAFGGSNHHAPRPAHPSDSKPDSGPPPSSTLTTASSPAQPQRAPRASRDGRFERDRSNMSRGEEGDTDSFSGRRSGGPGLGAKYPDTHQLFVGNLPHNISEKELKVFFEQWGKVMELRINTKSSGGKLPNFGFVVFDSPQPVQDCLRQKPIMYNGEQRLNVEEKKPRGVDGRMPMRGAPRGAGGGPARGGFGRGGMKPGFGRPNDMERRGMGGPQRGAMTGPPRR